MKPPPTVLHTCLQCLNKITEIKWLFLWWVTFCCRFSYCKSLQSLPFLWWVDFVHKQSNSYLRTREKKDKRDIFIRHNEQKQIGPISKRYPSSSLLIWSQKPMMYSQSSCLFVGWVALSDTETHEWLTRIMRYSLQNELFSEAHNPTRQHLL